MGNVPEVLSRDGSDSYLSVFLSNASFSGILNGGMIEQDDTSNGPMMPLQHTAPTEQNINDVPRGDAILRGRNEEDILTQALRINQDRAARFETLTRNEGLKKPYQQSRTFVKEVSKCYRTRSKRSISERKRNDMCIIDLLGLRKDQDFWRVMDRVDPAQYLTDNDRIAIKRFLAHRSNTHSETLARAEMEIEVAGLPDPANRLRELQALLIRPGVNNAQLMGLEKISSTIRNDPELFLFYRDCFCQDRPGKTEFRDAWIAHFELTEPLPSILALPDLDLDDATESEGGWEEDLDEEDMRQSDGDVEDQGTGEATEAGFSGTGAQSRGAAAADWESEAASVAGQLESAGHGEVDDGEVSDSEDEDDYEDGLDEYESEPDLVGQACGPEAGVGGASASQSGGSAASAQAAAAYWHSGPASPRGSPSEPRIPEPDGRPCLVDTRPPQARGEAAVCFFLALQASGLTTGSNSSLKAAQGIAEPQVPLASCSSCTHTLLCGSTSSRPPRSHSDPSPLLCAPPLLLLARPPRRSTHVLLTVTPLHHSLFKVYDLGFRASSSSP